MLKKILHTGLAVPHIQDAITLYESLGFELVKQFHKPDIDAQVAIMEKGEAAYELFEFNRPEHPQVKFIRNHVAFYSDDLQADIDTFLERGCTLTIPIMEGVIFRFAYVQDQSGMNYEIATEKL